MVHKRTRFIHKIIMFLVAGTRFTVFFYPFIFVYHVEKRFRCSIGTRGKALLENSVTFRQLDDVFSASEVVGLMLPGSRGEI